MNSRGRIPGTGTGKGIECDTSEQMCGQERTGRRAGRLSRSPRQPLNPGTEQIRNHHLKEGGEVDTEVLVPR